MNTHQRLSAASSALALLASQAGASETVAPDSGRSAVLALDTVVVTGTRTEQTQFETTSPVDLVSRDAIENSGFQTIRQTLGRLIPSYYGTSGIEAIGYPKSAGLRGLQSDQTIVLVNGKRRHRTASLNFLGQLATGTSPVDLDLIPVSLVERIEVLRDGASAEYGSDAIAGVINIILRDDPGGMASIQGGSFLARGDGDEFDAQIYQGFALSGGGALGITASYTTQALTNYAGLNLERLYPLLPNGDPDPREATAERQRQILGLPEQERFVAGYNFSSPLTASGAASFYSFGTVAFRTMLGYGNDRFPNSIQNIPEIYPDGFIPGLETRGTDYQVVVGVNGETGDWTWDVSASISNNREERYGVGTINPSLGPDSPTDFYLGESEFVEWITNADIAREFRHGALGGPLTVAVGAEYRRNEFDQREGEPASYLQGDYVFADGPFAGRLAGGAAAGFGGFSPADRSNETRNNYAVYLDVSQAVTENWLLEAAVRYEDYSDFGDALTYKVATRFDVTDAFAVRGTVNTGFRAPTLQQQFFGLTLPTFTFDPATGDQDFLLFNYVPSNSPAAIALGGGQTQPEESQNYSAGLVWETPFGITASVDVYQIDIDDRIRGTGSLSGPVVTEALEAAGLPGSQIVRYFSNILDTRTRGFDIVLNYPMDLGEYGAIDWSLVSNFNETTIEDFNDIPPVLVEAGIDPCDRVCQATLTETTPENQVRLGAVWTLDGLSVSADLRRFSSIVSRLSNDPARDDVAGAEFIADLNLSYRLASNTTVSVGAENLFNNFPDEVQEANRNPYLQGGGFSGFASVGNNYNLFSPLGPNGGFYYLRIMQEW